MSAAVIILATAAFFMVASPALALICVPRNTWVERLEAHYGETPLAFGLTADGMLMELFATPDRSTWTLIITDPNGTSCGLANGENWQKAVPELINPTGFPA